MKKLSRFKWGAVKSVKSGTRIAVVIGVFGVVGAHYLLQSMAATYATSSEAESGTLATATKVSDASASGGTAVSFGSSATTAPVIVGHQLLKGSTGTRLKMDGVTVWGIQDQITGSFGSSEYANRQTIINTIKAWGGNHIRFRLLADDYNSQRYMSKAQYIQEIKDWRDASVAAGLYFMPIWWDGLDGAYSQGNWAASYSQAFPMMTDVVNALGKDPMVLYEPFNEPTNAPSTSQWLTAMEATVKHFRNDLKYTGVLVMDARGWSHYYDDTNFTALETYDGTLTGMNGKNQIIFAKHDYANESYANPDSGFDSGHWPVNNDGGGTWNFTKHMVWETEFGNYNGSASTQHLAWSNGAATWMADKVNDGTLAGASAFVWGPWLDANAITTSNNTTPTTWGGYAKNNLLNRVQ